MATRNPTRSGVPAERNRSRSGLLDSPSCWGPVPPLLRGCLSPPGGSRCIPNQRSVSDLDRCRPGCRGLCESGFRCLARGFGCAATSVADAPIPRSGHRTHVDRGGTGVAVGHSAACSRHRDRCRRAGPLGGAASLPGAGRGAGDDGGLQGPWGDRGLTVRLTPSSLWSGVLKEGSLRLLHGLNRIPPSMRGPPTGSRTSLSSKVLLAAPAAWIGGPRVMSLAGAVITLLALYRLRSRADRRRPCSLATPQVSRDADRSAPNRGHGVEWVDGALCAGTVLALAPAAGPASSLGRALPGGGPGGSCTRSCRCWLRSGSGPPPCGVTSAGGGVILAAAVLYLPFFVWSGPDRFLRDILGHLYPFPPSRARSPSAPCSPTGDFPRFRYGRQLWFWLPPWWRCCDGALGISPIFWSPPPHSPSYSSCDRAEPSSTTGPWGWS